MAVSSKNIKLDGVHSMFPHRELHLITVNKNIDNDHKIIN